MCSVLNLCKFRNKLKFFKNIYIGEIDIDEPVARERYKQKQTATPTSSRKYRLPPMVIKGKPSAGKHINLINFLNGCMKDRKYKIKCTTNINIYVNTNEAHEKLVRDFKEESIDFHTYT